MKALHKDRMRYVNSSDLKQFIKDMCKEASYIKNQPTIEKLRTLFRPIAFIAQTLKIHNKNIHKLIEAWEVGLLSSLNENYAYPLSLRQDTCEPDNDREDLLFLSVLIDEKIGFKEPTSVYFYTVELMVKHSVCPCMPQAYTMRDNFCLSPGDIADVLPFLSRLLVDDNPTILKQLLIEVGKTEDSLFSADTITLFEQFSALNGEELIYLCYEIQFGELNVNVEIKNLLLENHWFISNLISDHHQHMIQITPEDMARGLHFLDGEFDWTQEDQLNDICEFISIYRGLYDIEIARSECLEILNELTAEDDVYDEDEDDVYDEDEVEDDVYDEVAQFNAQIEIINKKHEEINTLLNMFLIKHKI